MEGSKSVQIITELEPEGPQGKTSENGICPEYVKFRLFYNAKYLLFPGRLS
jgi:hypothetical protein